MKFPNPIPHNPQVKYLWVILSLLFFSAFTPGEITAATVGSCGKKKSDYLSYKIRAVRIEGPLIFLNKLGGGGLNSVKPTLAVKENQLFDPDNLEAGRKKIQNFLNSNQSAEQAIQINIILTKLENCSEPKDNEPGWLDVVYKVFTTNYNAYLSHTWEIKKKQIETPGAATDTLIGTDRPPVLLTVSPFAAYNRTRRLYGGGEVALQTPDNSIDAFRIGGSGSQEGGMAEAEIRGDFNPLKPALNYLDYSLSYKYLNLPATNNRLREGTVQLQLNAATKPLGGKGVIVRYGVALEGGNRQSNLAASAANQESVANSGYGALKTYVGTTFVTNSVSFTASYGLQIGTNGKSAKIQFVKHVTDLAFTRRWVPENQPGKVHKVLTLDTRLAAGAIQTFGLIPVGERFFGGNAPEKFISNNNWEILSNPFIRSIPQNRLNSDTTIGAIGGDRFYSVNVTVARPVWGKPLLFKEFDEDSDLFGALEAATNSSRSILKNYYAVKLNLYAKVIDAILEDSKNPVDQVSLKTRLTGLLTVFDSLPENLPGEEPADEEEDEEEEEKPPGYADKSVLVRDKVSLLLNRSLKTRDKTAEALMAIITNADPTGCESDPDQCGSITTIVKKSKDLTETIRQSLQGQPDSSEKENLLRQAERIDALSDDLVSEQVELNTLLAAIDLAPAEKLANADVKDVEQVIGVIRDELNLYSISPVGMFDVARVYPDRFGTRFGLGAGIRVSIANLNVTFGYVFSLNPKPNEGRGAFTFSIDVADIFR